MKNKLAEIKNNKNKTIPILSFPSAQLMGISVSQLLSSAENIVSGMLKIRESCNIGASLNMMDLSVEAQCFGAKIRFYDNEVPAVEKGIIEDIGDVSDIKVPEIGLSRDAVFIESIRLAKKKITDMPVFAGVIGPFSLAGRLFDITEIMMECYSSPDEVKILLEKASEFISGYIKELKKAGADGIIMAEPVAGLLSPALNNEFSIPYVEKIFSEINDEDFIICYHNCGPAVTKQLREISTLSADFFHFGNAVDLKEALDTVSEEKLIMGNIDPVLFLRGTPEEIEIKVQELFDNFSSYDNFMISSGCDIPPSAKWENINAYFRKVEELYA